MSVFYITKTTQHRAAQERCQLTCPCTQDGQTAKFSEHDMRMIEDQGTFGDQEVDVFAYACTVCGEIRFFKERLCPWGKPI